MENIALPRIPINGTDDNINNETSETTVTTTNTITSSSLTTVFTVPEKASLLGNSGLSDTFRHREQHVPEAEFAIGSDVPARQNLSRNVDSSLMQPTDLGGFSNFCSPTTPNDIVSSTPAKPVDNMPFISLSKDISTITEEPENNSASNNNMHCQMLTLIEEETSTNRVLEAGRNSQPTIGTSINEGQRNGYYRNWNEILRERKDELHYKETDASFSGNRSKKSTKVQKKHQLESNVGHATREDVAQDEPNLLISYTTELTNQNTCTEQSVRKIPDRNATEMVSSISLNNIPQREPSDVTANMLEHIQTSCVDSNREILNSDEEYKRFVLNNQENLKFLMDNAEKVYAIIKARQRHARERQSSTQPLPQVRRFDPKVLFDAPIELLEIRQKVMKALICHRAIDFTKIEGLTNRKCISHVFTFIMELRSIGFIKLAEDGRKISLADKLPNYDDINN